MDSTIWTVDSYGLMISEDVFKSFYVTGLFLYPLKTSGWKKTGITDGIKMSSANLSDLNPLDSPTSFQKNVLPSPSDPLHEMITDMEEKEDVSKWEDNRIVFTGF